MFNRLWPLAVGTVLAGAIGFFFPQVPVVATGFFLLVALLWRNQSRAVAAIEGRDGVEFWFDRTSPLGAPEAAAAARAAPGRAGELADRALQRIDERMLRWGSRCAPIRVVPGAAYAPRFRSFRSSSHGRVFATFSAVSQARRAVATP